MMWKEFEKLAGYEVSYKDYSEVIEPMYMATNLSKKDFVKVLDRKQFDLDYRRKMVEKKLVKEMKELAEEMHDLCGRTTTFEIYDELRAKAKEYINEFPEWLAPHHDFEKAIGYSNCTYITALCYYDKDWNEVKRIQLVK